ncbi:bifunctional diguanylate cyclase/phosphodiesterase [Actinoplanes sp. M2I2]|uniref:putative bifunctional diguanylate cyclase/phosphodiesterase n=1 Tax=Actinoplanes sp. M2I2 TaxID=1734444 RepID=UPI0020208428|nr:bifunctional diguanylate cyclase/phosphodiesterase [Actinoplanes sp. M2I2]
MEYAKRNGLALGGAALVVLSAGWLVIGLGHEWAYPVLGWVPLPVSAGLAAYACLRVSRSERIEPATRRFWRHLAVAGVLLAGGTISNAVDALGGAQPSQRVGPVTVLWYLAVMGVVIWALLRLPTWQRSRGDLVRFALDACVILVAATAFVWQFSLRGHRDDAGLAGPVLVMVAVGFVAVITFVKVALAGAGRLDRRALRILSGASALSAVTGGLTPFLSGHPYLSSSFVAVPVGALGLVLAAEQQRRGECRESRPRASSRTSVLPYVAVVAMDALLLTADGGSTAVRVSTAVLTVLVLARQVYALRENRYLLTTVDANLAQLRDYQDQLTYQATHDPLTGVGNRALFAETVDVLLAARAPFHVALLDMDDFKSVNDRLGHHTGDQLLEVVSRRLRATVGPDGLVARLGGDEFAIVLRDLHTARVEVVLDRVLEALREPPRLAGAVVRGAASIGVTTARPDDTGGELLRRADVAMYEAKAAGGDRRRWFDAALDEQAREAARLGDDLLHALDRDELFLLYQPIVELPGGGPAGVEVLLRWRHPSLGLVPPDVFVPLAERNGTIVEIGRWVLENACRQAALWQHRFGPAAPAKVSINVSARQLAEPGFVADVEQILSRTGADRGRLLLEVTETAVLEAGAPLDAVRELRERGLRVALDDFGTGQSSLSLLLTVPVDVLKVDKSFVSGAAAGQAGAVIVEHLIGFTNGLRMEAVAEGVETEAQALRLHAAGYSLAQGYLFGRPTTAAEIEAGLLSPVR